MFFGLPAGCGKANLAKTKEAACFSNKALSKIQKQVLYLDFLIFTLIFIAKIIIFIAIRTASTLIIRTVDKFFN